MMYQSDYSMTLVTWLEMCLYTSASAYPIYTRAHHTTYSQHPQQRNRTSQLRLYPDPPTTRFYFPAHSSTLYRAVVCLYSVLFAAIYLMSWLLLLLLLEMGNGKNRFLYNVLAYSKNSMV